MRKLMWFTIGFAAACAAGVYFGIGVWLGILCAVLAFPLFFLKRPLCLLIAVVLLGGAVGAVWTWGYSTYYLQQAREYDGKTIAAEAIISDYSYDTDYGVAADCEVTLDGTNFRTRLYLEEEDALAPGDCVKGSFRFRLTTADSQQGETYHQGIGIFLLVYADKDSTVTRAEHVPSKYFPAQIRNRMSQMIKSTFPEDAAAFATALLLGDSSMLSYEADTDFKLSGIRHVIAVSGLHVSILMSVVYIFSARTRYLSPIIGIPVLILFAAVIGFTPSVTRACIMQILILLALMFNKDYDPPTALAFAALIMLLINPWTIVSVSFQLSSGCIIGIFLFYERTHDYFMRKLKIERVRTKRDRFLYRLCSGVAITLSTMITTIPLSAAYFGTVSLVSIVTNLLTLWVISFIFYGILLVCIVGLLWMPLATVLAWIVSLPIRYVCLIARILSSLPYSAVYTCSVYIVVWLVMCYLIFTVFLFSRPKPAWWLLGSAAVGLVLALLLSWAEPLGDRYRVTVFDVGQGQSILLECDGKKILIDCGGDTEKGAADTVSQYLHSRSVDRLDAVVVTHYDKDHAGGVPLLLSEISVGSLYLPDTVDETGMRDTLSSSHENICWVGRYTVLETACMKLSMIPGEHETQDNERSMCVLFQTENCVILVTGDRSTVGEKALLQDVQLPEVDILVAGHHGSATSTSMELLHAVQPKIAVISVAQNNFYGHPAQSVLYRLELFRCKIFRTDLNGTIVFKG